MLLASVLFKFVQNQLNGSMWPNNVVGFSFICPTPSDSSLWIFFIKIALYKQKFSKYGPVFKICQNNTLLVVWWVVSFFSTHRSIEDQYVICKTLIFSH
jgi:hypothetical protein